jgi:hypothetical protein
MAHQLENQPGAAAPFLRPTPGGNSGSSPNLSPRPGLHIPITGWAWTPRFSELFVRWEPRKRLAERGLQKFQCPLEILLEPPNFLIEREGHSGSGRVHDGYRVGLNRWQTV